MTGAVRTELSITENGSSCGFCLGHGHYRVGFQSVSRKFGDSNFEILAQKLERDPKYLHSRRSSDRGIQCRDTPLLLSGQIRESMKSCRSSCLALRDHSTLRRRSSTAIGPDNSDDRKRRCPHSIHYSDSAWIPGHHRPVSFHNHRRIHFRNSLAATECGHSMTCSRAASVPGREHST